MVKIGEEVEILGFKDTQKTTITGIECSTSSSGRYCRRQRRTSPPRYRKGRCYPRMVLAKSGSVKPHTDFEAEVYILKKEEGGRHTPFFTGYKPQFYIRTTDVTGE